MLFEVLKTNEEISDSLHSGNLLNFETHLRDCFQSLQSQVSQLLLEDYCEQELESLAAHYSSEDYNRFQKSTTSFRISTGTELRLPDLYARHCSEALPSGHRNVLQRHFSIIGGSSPLCYSLIGLSAVACPSYDTANELLSSFNLHQSVTRVRNVANALGDFCQGNEAFLIHEKQETLSEKSVLIAIDGGRCRSREYNKGRNQAGHLLFSTDWREPKLFVIQVFNQDGSFDKEHRCVYGGRFGEERFWESLGNILQSLKIDLACRVQIAADGAQWIWDKVADFLAKLGVAKDKIIQTLDYYHASSYLHNLIESIPKTVNDKKDNNSKQPLPT